MIAQLTWGEDGAAEVATVDALDAQLAELDGQARRDGPFMVDVTSEAGDTLSIGLGLGLGLGRDATILSWTGASLDPPYYASVGEAAGDGEPVEFAVGGEPSEFPPDQLVPMAAGREAVREFVRTGKRPGAVRWQEV